MRTSFLVSALLLSTSTAALAADHQHVVGDCAVFSWNMAREFELLRAAPVALPAIPAADPEARLAPLERRLDLALLPSKQVRLQVAPRREPAPDSYAGILKLRVNRAGTYRVSASQRLWIELVGPAGVVKSSKFAMQAGCESLRKSVAFALDPETDYWIELSGSPTSDPVLLITPDR